MSRKLTKEEFINREPDLLNGEYEMLGNYYGSPVKTLFKHTSCGYKWMLTPADFHRGVRCPKCVVRKPTFTKEAFVEREEDIQSGEYEMLGRYVNTSVKTLFKHNVCGREWEMQPSSFHRGYRCPHCRCGGFSTDMFCERERDIQSGEYTLLENYINDGTKIAFRHNSCGNVWEISPGYFHMGGRCPKCRKNRKHISRDSKLGWE